MPLVITRDNIRVLNPHQKRISKTFVSKTDLKRIMELNSQSPENELKLYSERANIAEEAAKRKSKYEEYEKKRNVELSDLEKEQREASNHLLKKAQMQRDEQESEIKELNELIMHAKCVAVRDLQILEKNAIKAELKAEEARLDAMMERNRIDGIKKMQEREEQRQRALKRGAEIIEQQIAQRKEQAILEAEKKEQATLQTLKAINLRQEQDKQEKICKKREQRILMDEVAKANLIAIKLKKQLRENDRLEDARVLKYLVEKDQMETQKEKKEQKRKLEREKEISRLRAAQKKLADKFQDQDSLRAKRASEAYEREWRKKELESKQKKQQQEDLLKTMRTQQQIAREHAIAAEAMKLRMEYNENLARQLELEQKDNLKEQQRKQKNKEYSQELKEQIHLKIMQRRKERENDKNLGLQLKHEQQLHEAKINQIKEQKLKNLPLQFRNKLK